MYIDIDMCIDTLQYADLTLLLPCPAAPSTAETRCLSCARAEGSLSLSTQNRLVF